MRRCCLLLVCLLLLTGCGRADTQDVSSFAPAEGDRLVIFTSHKETIYEPILKEFEQRTGIWVELETGGTVTLLERIAAGESGADLMFGGGADSLSAYSACFAPYVSEYAGDVAPEYDLGGGIWTPFSALPVVLIYNTKLVRQNPPERWADLLDAGWRGRIAFADPTVSGSSCTALGTLLQAVGGNTDNTLAAFFRNLDGRIIADSGGVVPAVADGSCYVGVTLEENARKAIADGLDVAIVYPAEGTSVLPDGAAIVRGCAHEENARKFIDFLLSPDVQQLLGAELSRRSVRTDTASDALPELTVLPYDLRGVDDLLLVDATWRLLYASQPLRADDTLALLRAQLLSGKSLSDGDGERSYYVGACAESGFSLILQQPQTYTAQVVRSIYLVAALMGALCLVLCLVCAWWLSRRLFEPVNELDGAMRRVEGGDYDVRIESTRQDEMGRLAASFDRMTAEYRQNLERSVQRERELNETRLRMLQSQLNPHFLYNTLDCMKWLGVTGGVPQVAELAADLAALLRAGISGSEYITLEEELELIGRYLAIQEVRFGDRFVCELDVDERFQHCVVPKLILQPLVENAIIHGVADSDEGFIKLWAEEDAEGYLLLKVSDNGSGIPPEVLERLNSHELIPGGHLGLNNVDRIVRLSYGESCGLSAYPNEGGGSCVQLRLPMQKGEDHAQGTDR